LNNILDIAIPKHDEEGGTYIVPGHGRICDEYDVLEYRDMVTIVRDRIANAIRKGQSLEQVRKAGFTKDYDSRYSAKSGLGNADRFVEAVYKSLTADKK
jgi:cyclase